MFRELRRKKQELSYQECIEILINEKRGVLSVLGACVKCGDEIEFVCDGDDESEALQALINAVDSGLGE